MIIDLERLEEVKLRFIELGSAVSDLSNKNKESFDSLILSTEKLRVSITSTISVEGINTFAKNLNASFDQFNKFSTLIDSVSDQIGKSGDFSESIKKSSEVFSKLSKDISNLYEEKKVKPSVPMIPIIPTTPKDKEEKERPRLPVMIRREVSGVRSRIGQLLGALKIPRPGTILAGGLLWMAYGFQEQDKLRAMAGQARNIVVTAFDSGVKGMVDKATYWIRDFSKEAERQLGIPKEEIYSIEKAFVDAGATIEETVVNRVDRSLGLVGRNMVTFSLAVDKLFELAAGTTADRMIGFMRDFGMNMTEAKNTIMEMMFYGKESGVGAEYFVSNIEKATASLSSLGLSLDNISDMLRVLQDRLEAIGVPRHLAAKEVARGLSEVAQGLTGLSADWKLFLGEILGYGKGLEAKQAFEDAVIRMTKAEPESFADMVYKITDALRDKIPEEAELREVLHSGLGWGIKGSRFAMEWSKAVESGDVNRMGELKKDLKDFQRDLRDSFKTEREKVSSFQRNMNLWMEGIAEVGKGLLGITSNILAFLVGFFRAIPHLFSNLFDKDREKKNERIMATVGAFSSANMEKHEESIVKGFTKLKKAGSKLMGDAFGKSMDNLRNAWNMDFTKIGSKTDEELRSDQSKASVSAMVEAPTGIRMVPVPIREPGVFPLEMPEQPQPEGILEALGSSPEEAWVGGELKIESRGVDDSGNMRLRLVGSCPKCGLLFGDHAEMLERESLPMTGKFLPGADPLQFIHGNVVGDKMTVDFSKPGEFERFSEFAKSGRARRQITRELDPRLMGVLQKIGQRFPGRAIKVFRGAAEEGGKGRHAAGQALDLAVKGVSNEDLMKFLRSEKFETPIGRGYYPNLPFVHVDIREKPAEWVDVSRSGEAPKNLPEATAWLNKNIGKETEEVRSPEAAFEVASTQFADKAALNKKEI